MKRNEIILESVYMGCELGSWPIYFQKGGADMASYHAKYGDVRDAWIGNHFSDTKNREKVLDIIYDYMDILDLVNEEEDDDI